MSTMLPTPPELSARRQDEIRAELLRSLDTDRRWQRPVVIATAAASVLAVGVGVTTWQLTGDGPALQRLEPAGPPIPGLPDEERAEIESRCTQAANRMDIDVDGLNLPPTIDGDYVAYNVAPVGDGGRYALLYDLDRHLEIGCSVDGKEPGLGSFGADMSRPQRDIRWMAGALSEEHYLATAKDTGGGHAFSAGRVSEQVERVTLTSGGRTIEASIANGTYIGSIEFPAEPPEPVTVRAYDAEGNLLAERDASRDGCWITPDGEVIQGDSNKPEECEPAQRWPQAN